ncbi:hypothetical protein [Solidesulfovibrio magneticus]|uniref:Uncharacterized protein n=1 Tax=Solidesulfovibrio magneticus (strain ATCC 700980 / DSM 13731 / RS-1) TaxID=573370 RepID=C4XTU4_SOLM1|nr:hypothetical protein [Solidesulfovibrio magneticus]BAH73609.1 hypothetical protein DMR_01180 [Solidesulfovibrio magneticus RS-1]
MTRKNNSLDDETVVKLNKLFGLPESAEDAKQICTGDEISQEFFGDNNSSSDIRKRNS